MSMPLFELPAGVTPPWVKRPVIAEGPDRGKDPHDVRYASTMAANTSHPSPRISIVLPSSGCRYSRFNGPVPRSDPGDARHRLPSHCRPIRFPDCVRVSRRTIARSGVIPTIPGGLDGHGSVSRCAGLSAKQVPGGVPVLRGTGPEEMPVHRLCNRYCAFWRGIVVLARIAVLLAGLNDWPIGVARDSTRPLRFAMTAVRATPRRSQSMVMSFVALSASRLRARRLTGMDKRSPSVRKLSWSPSKG